MLFDRRGFLPQTRGRLGKAAQDAGRVTSAANASVDGDSAIRIRPTLWRLSRRAAVAEGGDPVGGFAGTEATKVPVPVTDTRFFVRCHLVGFGQPCVLMRATASEPVNRAFYSEQLNCLAAALASAVVCVPVASARSKRFWRSERRPARS